MRHGTQTKLRPCFNEWAEKIEQKQQAAAAAAAAASPATVPETEVKSNQITSIDNAILYYIL